MEDLNSLLNICSNRFNNHVCFVCTNNNYCRTCNESDNCAKCLDRIHYNHTSENITYNCNRIIYRYVLQYFNRFCSEIYYEVSPFVNQFTDDDINIVSIGCGPNSELYGIIEAFRVNEQTKNIHYYGFDTNRVWIPIWTINQQLLDGDHLSQEYPKEDPSTYFAANDIGEIDLFVMNYLLSDISRQDAESKEAAIQSICNLILQIKPKVLLYNDISYYTNKPNSGYGCLISIVKRLAEHELSFSCKRFLTFHGPTFYMPANITFGQSQLYFTRPTCVANIVTTCASCASTQLFFVRK